MELNKNAILLLLLLAANLVLVAKGEETEGGDKSFVEVCSSERGRMAVSPRYGTAQSQFRTCRYFPCRTQFKNLASFYLLILGEPT